jgi:hypothetical protein
MLDPSYPANGRRTGLRLYDLAAALFVAGALILLLAPTASNRGHSLTWIFYSGGGLLSLALMTTGAALVSRYRKDRGQPSAAEPTAASDGSRNPGSS